MVRQTEENVSMMREKQYLARLLGELFREPDFIPMHKRGAFVTLVEIDDYDHIAKYIDGLMEELRIAAKKSVNKRIGIFAAIFNRRNSIKARLIRDLRKAVVEYSYNIHFAIIPDGTMQEITRECVDVIVGYFIRAELWKILVR